MTFPRKIAQVFIISIVVGLSLVLVMGIWKGKAQKSQQPAAQAGESAGEMKLTDMEFTEMQQGKRFWTLCASEATYFQDQQKTLLKAVRMNFYMNKDEELQLESKEGTLHAGTKNVELRDSVRVILPRDYVITSERALYDHKNKTISSDEPIRISGPGLELEGRRWEYRIPEHVAAIGGGVTASMVGARIRLEGQSRTAPATTARKR